MIISNNAAPAVSTGIESSAFGVEMNAKMYSIMIDKLYTNKEGAVIRELCFNAIDSHKEAGTTRPFEVTLPSYFDKTFRIRDYGTGIDPGKFKHIYTNAGGGR